MFLLRCCSRLPLSCLLFASVVSPGGFAQSSTPQNKAPVVAPPTATKQWTGDLDVLLQHQIIRIGVPYSKTLYYTVKGTQYGVAYEGGKAFEEYLNKKYRQQLHKNLKIYVIFMVTPPDKAVSNLTDGNLDILIGDLIITPERQKLVDFSDSTVNGITRLWSQGPILLNLRLSTTCRARKCSSARARATGSIWNV